MKFSGIFGLIPRQFRARGVLVVLSSIMQAVLNLAGLAVLVPVLLLLISPEGISDNKWLSGIRSAFGFIPDNIFIWTVCAGVVLFVLLKGLANLGIARFQNRYLMSLYRYYAQKMLDSYYRRGLLFIKGRNSAKLTYEVNHLSMLYVQNVPMNVAAMISDALLVVFMLAAIFRYNHMAGIMIFAVFAPIMGIYILSIRKRLASYGQMENEERRRQSRLVQEAFRGYSEIEINNAFPGMETQFDEGLKKISRYRETVLTVRRTPEVIIETGIAVVLAALVLLKVDAVLLAIFGVAALRMLPAIKNTITGWITLKNSMFAGDIIEENIGVSPDNPGCDGERMVFRSTVGIENLGFGFGPGEPPVIDNFSLEIRKGERLGIKGISGGGKTTLFNLLLGLYPPSSGRIVIDGVPLTAANRRSWQNIVGYVPQEVFIMDSSIAENIALGADVDRDRVRAALEAARLGDFLAGLSEGIDTPIGEGGSRLSGGQKQRIGIARALYKNAEVLFFDEATSSLDSKTESEINDAIRELSRTHRELTIIIIAHREGSLAFCDRVIEMG